MEKELCQYCHKRHVEDGEECCVVCQTEFDIAFHEAMNMMDAASKVEADGKPHIFTKVSGKAHDL